jgi:hypothetical protein
MLKWALDNGCPRTSDDLPGGQPVLSAAIAKGHLHVVQLLCAHGAWLVSMHNMLAARRGQLDVLRWLDAQGVPLPPTDFKRACSSAALMGCLAELQWLLRPDRPTEHLLPAACLEHALRLATEEGHVAVQQYLRVVGPAVSY